MRTFQRGLQIDCEQKPPIDQCPVILVRQTSRGQRGIPVDAAVMHWIMYQPARPFIAYGTHCPGHFDLDSGSCAGGNHQELRPIGGALRFAACITAAMVRRLKVALAISCRYRYGLASDNAVLTTEYVRQ